MGVRWGKCMSSRVACMQESGGALDMRGMRNLVKSLPQYRWGFTATCTNMSTIILPL